MQHSEPVSRPSGLVRPAVPPADLLPTSPVSKALKYAMSRQGSLQAFLADPNVPNDTNHLERGLRPIPMGKKNYLFAWTEIGAERIGFIQSLLATCRLRVLIPTRI
ncbi:MAG: transposase [Haliea sp.]|nr:transposase [Haliea sp.]